MNETDTVTPITIAIHYTISPAMPPHARTRILEAYTRLLDMIALADGLRRDPVERTAPILATWDRAFVLQQIEEASGQALSANESLPDSLIASAQALGLQPWELGVWIYESGHDFRTSQLAAWARRNGFGKAQAGAA
jgi:hypothetical protein